MTKKESEKQISNFAVFLCKVKIFPTYPFFTVYKVQDISKIFQEYDNGEYNNIF
jgi:hypothetical protein